MKVVLNHRADGSRPSEYTKISNLMKLASFFVLLAVYFCVLLQSNLTKTDLWTAFPIVWIPFFIDVYFVKENRKIEYQVYELEKEELNSIEESNLGHNLNHVIKEPSPKISLPLTYYIIITTMLIALMLVFVK